MSDDFTYWYLRGCEELDHGNPLYGASIIEGLRDDLAARGLPGLPEVGDDAA
ncbi:hypothetical protein [Corynebacterium sp.]|uniref:hypothetical protein n=1 Tax=Corynebacterium sp. TaxID=1720 RepID=UPI0025B97C44|nr:hypothetical protein [Corynebacterium sp.]